ncbi:hypothetical protein P3T39_006297 [Kitasatospora sp. GP82]|nr:hypothetical protein [Kitasatospora sp. GP82]
MVEAVTVGEAERLARAYLRGQIRGWTDDGWTLRWDEWASGEDGYVFEFGRDGGLPAGAPVFVARTGGECRLMPAREYSGRRRPRLGGIAFAPVAPQKSAC